MKHSSAEKPVDMCNQGESSTEWPEHLDSQIPRDEAKIELDEEDQNDLNSDAWFVLNQVVELRMKPELRSDIIKLIDRLEETLGWYKHN